MICFVPKDERVGFWKLWESFLPYFFGELQVEIPQRFESEEQTVVKTEGSVVYVYFVDNVVIFSVIMWYFQYVALVIVYDMICCVTSLHYSQ